MLIKIDKMLSEKKKKKSAEISSWIQAKAFSSHHMLQSLGQRDPLGRGADLTYSP